MSRWFQIKGTGKLGDTTFVLARRMDDSDWRFGADTRLGGVRVAPWLRRPSLLASGHVWTDVMAFVLRDPMDRERLRAGDIVELSG